MKKYQCKCCGYYTLEDKPLNPHEYPGTFEICPVCFWEDDSLQYLYPDKNFGPNGVSLNEARENFKNIGAVRSEMLKYVRKPLPDEIGGSTVYIDEFEGYVKKKTFFQKIRSKINVFVILTRIEPHDIFKELQKRR